MANLIDYTITKRQFELIELRLGQVLADELVYQATENLDTDLNPTIFLERVIPIDKSEVQSQPLINIQMARGSYDNYKNLVKDGTYTFYIDCYAIADSDNANRGDTLARYKVQRLLGVIDAILSNPIYNTLAFDKPSLSRCEVLEILFPDAQEYLNAPHLLMGRLVYSVRVPENIEEITLSTIEEYSSQVKLYSTEQGYLFSGATPVIPPPPVCANATVTNSDGSFTYEIASGATYILPDINLTVNGAGFLSIPSVKDQNIILKSTLGDIITPAQVTNNEIIIELSAGADMKVDFTVDNTAPDEAEQIQFTAQITEQTATEWYWDFGDGNSSTLENPTHTYAAAGLYTVTLLAGNASNKGGFEEKIDYIDVQATDLGVVLLLDATDSTTINGGSPSDNDPVTAWADQSGQGNSPTTVGSNLTWKASGFAPNSTPYISIGATSSFNLGTAISKMPSHTVLTVWLATSFPSVMPVIVENGNSSSNQCGIAQIVRTSILEDIIGDGVDFGRFQDIGAAGNVSANTPYIYATRYNAGDSDPKMQFNGTDLTPDKKAGNGVTSIAGTKFDLRIGQFGQFGLYAGTLSFAYCKIYNRSLSDLELTSQVNILKTKFGIA